MQADAPGGVAGGSRDGAGASSREVVRARVEGFWTSGVTLPPMLGPRSRGTYVKTYFSGGESFEIAFGDIGFSMEVWTDDEGLGALIGQLQAARVRAQIARDNAPFVSVDVDEDDVPF